MRIKSEKYRLRVNPKVGTDIAWADTPAGTGGRYLFQAVPAALLSSCGSLLEENTLHESHGFLVSPLSFFQSLSLQHAAPRPLILPPASAERISLVDSLPPRREHTFT